MDWSSSWLVDDLLFHVILWYEAEDSGWIGVTKVIAHYFIPSTLDDGSADGGLVAHVVTSWDGYGFFQYSVLTCHIVLR